jgi:hypothetical protein
VDHKKPKVYKRQKVYVPTEPLKDKDIAQFIPLVKSMANKTCKKLSRYFYGPKISGAASLNILGDTYEDVYQELLLEVWLGTKAFLKETKKTYIPGYADYFDLAYYNYVKKCLARRSSKIIANMWVAKQGQAFNHVTGDDADVYFEGLSPAEVRDAKK